MARPTLSLIIPAYNEQSKIANDIKLAYDYFAKTNLTAEVIVVTDGITDQTNLIVQRLQRKYDSLILISHFHRLGKGLAIKQGVSAAKGKYIMYADSGMCVPFKFITTGLELLKKNDLAIGSRAVPGHKIKRAQPFYRQMGSAIFSLIIHYYIGIPKSIPDTQCGFKLFRNPVAKKLFAKVKVTHSLFEIELLLKALKLKYRIINFPVEWTNDSDSRFRLWPDTLTILRELHQIKTS